MRRLFRVVCASAICTKRLSLPVTSAFQGTYSRFTAQNQLDERNGMLGIDDFSFVRQPSIGYCSGKMIFCDPIFPALTLIASFEYTAIVTILSGLSISGSSS